ncbi:MAG: hypothetical protein H7222_03945 [Methylotenera sp.]|nr:hypothetical protein [Oligoflexia bacterium]
MGLRFLLLISTLFAVESGRPAWALDDSSQEEALCGPRPSETAPATAQDPAEVLHRIEKDMPPIHHQSTANWCYAFASCDLLNYQLHQNALKTDPAARYTTENQVAVIDAVATEKLWLDHNASPAPRHPGRINLNETGQDLNVLTALQLAGSVRSQQQIPFFAAEETEKLDRMLEADNAAPGDSVLSGTCVRPNPLYGSVVRNFGELSEILATAAKEEGRLKSGSMIIDEYTQLSLATEKPDITLPPFTPHFLQVTSPLHYLKQLRNNLQAKLPSIVGVCKNPLFPDSGSTLPGCGAHALTLVGAAYISGRCSVRLRNSEGSGWEEGGYVTMPLARFMASAKLDSTYNIDWIEPASPGDPKEAVLIQSDPRTGGIVNYRGTLRGTRGQVKWENGIATYPGGKSSRFIGGKWSANLPGAASITSPARKK